MRNESVALSEAMKAKAGTLKSLVFAKGSEQKAAQKNKKSYIMRKNLDKVQKMLLSCLFKMILNIIYRRKLFVTQKMEAKWVF